MKDNNLTLVKYQPQAKRRKAKKRSAKAAERALTIRKLKQYNKYKKRQNKLKLQKLDNQKLNKLVEEIKPFVNQLHDMSLDGPYSMSSSEGAKVHDIATPNAKEIVASHPLQEATGIDDKDINYESYQASTTTNTVADTPIAHKKSSKPTKSNANAPEQVDNTEIKGSEEAFGYKAHRTIFSEEDAPEVNTDMGFSDEDVVVFQSAKKHNNLLKYSAIVCKKRYKVALEELLTPNFIDAFFKDQCKEQLSALFKPSELVHAMMTVCQSQRPANGVITIRSVFIALTKNREKSLLNREDQELKQVSDRTLTEWLADHDFYTVYKHYTSLIHQIYYYECRRAALKSNNAMTKQVARVCRILNKKDIICQDSTNLQVFSETQQEANTKGSGADRTAAANAGLKDPNNTRNHILKHHCAYSLLTMTPVCVTTTAAISQDFLNVQYNALKRLGNVLFIGDRGYLDLINLIELHNNGVDFLVREKTSCSFRTIDCINDKNEEITELKGLAVNNELVKSAAKEHNIIDSRTHSDRSVNITRVTPAFYQKGYCSKPIKGGIGHQLTVAVKFDKARIVIVNNPDLPDDQSSRYIKNQREPLMFIHTSLGRDTAPMWVVYHLYKLRWSVELYFKVLKEGYGLVKVNARRCRSIINIARSSFISAIHNCYCMHLAGAMLEDNDSLEHRADVLEQYRVARLGVTRDLSEILRYLQALSKIAQGETPKLSVRFASLIPTKDRQNEDLADAKCINARGKIRASSIPELLHSIDNDNLLALQLSYTEKQELIIKALNEDEEALATFDKLDDFMKKAGLKHIHSRERLLEISELCKENNVDFCKFAWQRLSSPSLSPLQACFYTGNTDIFQTLNPSNSGYSSNTEDQVELIKADLNKRAKNILNHCLSKKPNLRTIERGNSAHLRMVYMEFQAIQLALQIEDRSFILPTPIPMGYRL